MDRQQVIGLVLITVIFIGWFYWSYEQQRDYVSRTPAQVTDSTVVAEQKPVQIQPEQPQTNQVTTDTSRFVPVTGPETLTVITKEYTAKLSRDGARLTSFKVNHYLENGSPAELLPGGAGHGLNYQLQLADGALLQTQSLTFQVIGRPSSHFWLSSDVIKTHPWSL